MRFSIVAMHRRCPMSAAGLIYLLLLLLDECSRKSGRLAAMSRRHRSKGIQWWNLAYTQQLMTTDPLSPESNLFITPPVHPLTRKQLKLVTKNPGTPIAVARGARLAVEECQHQFRNRRWNCPVSESNHGGSIFGKILKKGCRETGYVYAITSAALTYSVARACSAGTIYTCSCGPSEQLQQQTTTVSNSANHYYQQQQQHHQQYEHAQSTRLRQMAPLRPTHDWQWGGCSDNVEFGYKFSREFIDATERERDLRCAMNLHNNEAGRTHVSREMRQECKCHGMSGSCAIKTCWMRLPPFRQIGDVLKDKFNRAAKVDQGNDIRERSRLNLIPADSHQRAPSGADLVYYENSPSFCEADVAVGFRGVKGRECNATSDGIDGCETMCCGRGYHTERFPGRERSLFAFGETREFDGCPSARDTRRAPHRTPTARRGPAAESQIRIAILLVISIFHVVHPT